MYEDYREKEKKRKIFGRTGKDIEISMLNNFECRKDMT
jgi:hypothetical protein